MLHRARLCRSIIVCLSVRLSVTLRYSDQIGWSTSKIISQPNSLRLMRGLTPTLAIWCNGNTPEIRVEYRWGQFLGRKYAISSKRCEIGPRLLWWTNRKLPTRFRLVPKSMTLDDLELPKRSLAEKIVLRSPRGWKSWKLIAGTISPTPSLIVAQRPSTYSQGNRVKLGETRGGVEKVVFWSTKAAISLKRVKIEETLLWRTYTMDSPSLFRTVPSWTQYGLLFLRIGGSQPPAKTSIAIISVTGIATDFKFGR